MQTIPVIDMSPWWDGSAASRDAVAHQFADAAQDWGFLVVAGHRVPQALMQDIRAVTNEFFDQPMEAKRDVSAQGRPGGRGHYALLSKSHARTRGQADAPGDLRETFMAGAEPLPGEILSPAASRHFVPNVWPQVPARMGAVWQEYNLACQVSSQEMMRVCAHALGLDDDWFDDKLTRPISTLTAQYYPAQTTPPVPGQLRSGAHTDFGALTLLMTEDRPGGLQVLGRDEQWHDIRPVEGAFIVNLGDLLARWTNDRWRSALHRVVNPPEDAGSAARRLSIVHFQTPNHDALIECIPAFAGDTPHYPPTTAGAHFAEKMTQTDSVAKETR
jgi:isopenicillin N synthase-like dioxygenase